MSVSDGVIGDGAGLEVLSAKHMLVMQRTSPR